MVNPVVKPAVVPPWLLERLLAGGSEVPFSTYMGWVLHDPQHGADGSGRLRIGPQGDFVTSPSLGDDFAALLAPQLVEWLVPLLAHPALATGERLALVESGPGEGTLARDLALVLARDWPELAERLDLVLVEPNGGMAARQRQVLEASPLPVRWSSFKQLALAPVRGVVLAHEVLDALAVERIVWDGTAWRQQLVRLHGDATAEPSLRLVPGELLEPAVLSRLQPLGLLEPNPQRPVGWCTEFHCAVKPWLDHCAAGLSQGTLLVVDYALEAWRYFAPQRSNGTLMAYRQQQACSDPLVEPGAWDLTAHLCIDALLIDAEAAGWQPLGHCRQGEALLALGLAEQLHGLQRLPSSGLGEALARREALLRFVDPGALGDFRWLAFGRGVPNQVPRFRREPGPPTNR
jgi:SAM-dependent MidA family methyltransferase